MKKVVIIGGGPAGLTAAYELLKRAGGHDVTVLEMSGQVGGISRTVCHNGNRMDIGGHRFFSKDERIMDWWKRLMPVQGADSFDDARLRRKKPLANGGPDPEMTDRLLLIRDRVSRIYYMNKFFDYPVRMKLQTVRNLGFVRTVRAGCSYLKSAVVKKEEDSLENFYINRFGKVLYGMFFEGYTEKVWGRHPSGIRADWGSQRVRGLSVRTLVKDMFQKLFGGKDRGITRKNVETSLIEQFLYPKYGPGQLWETVAREVCAMGGDIRTGCRVHRIVCDGDRIGALEYECAGERRVLDADIVISSMPVKDLVGGISGTKPPADVRRVAAGLPYRDFVTVGVLAGELGLKNETKIRTLNDIVPDCWIYVQETGVKLGRIQIFNNWSPYMVQDVENTVWLGLEYFCNEGDAFWSMPEGEWIEFAVGELERMGIIRRRDVLDAHCEKVAKAYPAYFDTYAEIDTVIDYLDSIQNLYCVGRNGQHRYNNMDHSMLTSMYAVDCITGKAREKKNIWNVNTEKSYHEAKR